MILETERLVVRHCVEQDAEIAFALLYADEEVKRGWSGVTGTAEEIKQRFVEKHCHGEPFGLKAMCLKEGAFIGVMGYQRHEAWEEAAYLKTVNEPDRKMGQNPEEVEAELTYAIGRAYWKKGYASEMGRAMVAHGFETLGIRQIIQGVLGWNSNSIALMRRLGFRIEQQSEGDGVVGILDYADWKKTGTSDR